MLKIALLGDASHVNIQRWCDGLKQAGADVHLISFHATDSTEHQTYRLPAGLPGKLRYFGAAGRVRKLVRAIQPDLLVAYYATGYGTLAVMTGYRPLVQVTSGSDVLVAPKNPFMRSLLRYNLKRSDMVTAWAPHMAAAARNLGVVEERIMILPRGIPARHFAKTRAPLPAGDDPGRIIITRSLKAHYNHPLLLKAMHLVDRHIDNYSLTIAGDGPDRQKLSELSRALQIDGKVSFTGFVPNESLPLLLAQHNLYISLIDSDGVSASLLEAMAVGLLPIVPDNPSNRFWIKHNVNGLLIEKMTETAVADLVMQAIYDRDLRQRAWSENPGIVCKRADLYQNSQAFVSQFSRLVRQCRN